MRPLQRDPLPAAGNVTLGVIDRSVVRLRGAMRVKEEFCLAARVVVVKQACIDAEVAERLLVAAIEIHLQIAACITRVFGYVGVPVARVEAARIGVIKASLKRRLAE